MPLLTLRPYQEEALERIAAAEARGVRRPMLVAATGLGKTVMFCELARRRGGRALILAHRDELVAQAAAKVREIWPEADVGIVKGGQDEVDAQVVVASVQTLSRDRRLSRLVASCSSLVGEPFRTFVIDEAHHTAATSYRTVVDGLRAGTETGPLLLGVTATPDRGDGKGLDELFDEIVAQYDILWGITAGYLSDLRGIRVTLDADFGKLRSSHGDFDQGQAGRMLEESGGPDMIVQAWRQHAAGRRTLVFTPTIETAVQTAQAFQNAGIRAASVSGDVNIDERRERLARFSSGELEVVTNCAVLTEGYDEPRVDCVVVARPTRSRALYAQMIGRGTRRHPEKTDCLVLDVVGASALHSLVTIPSLFGIEEERAERVRSTGVSEVLEEQRTEQVRLGRLRAEEAELFRKVRAQRIAWVAVHVEDGPRRYIRPLPGVGVVSLMSDDGLAWTAALGDERQRATILRTFITNTTLEVATGVAEDFIRKSPSAHLAKADAAWRRNRPSERQLAAARKWKLTVDPKWTAGQLSEALDAHIERIRSRPKTTAGRQAG